MQAVGRGRFPVMVAGVPDVLRPLLDQVVSQGWPSSISASRAPARRGLDVVSSVQGAPASWSVRQAFHGEWNYALTPALIKS